MAENKNPASLLEPTTLCTALTSGKTRPLLQHRLPLPLEDGDLCLHPCSWGSLPGHWHAGSQQILSDWILTSSPGVTLLQHGPRSLGLPSTSPELPHLDTPAQGDPAKQPPTIGLTFTSSSYYIKKHRNTSVFAGGGSPAYAVSLAGGTALSWGVHRLMPAAEGGRGENSSPPQVLLAEKYNARGNLCFSTLALNHRVVSWLVLFIPTLYFPGSLSLCMHMLQFT